MKYLDRKSLIDASMQPYPCFLSFKLEEQRAGDNVYYLYSNIQLLFLALFRFVHTEMANVSVNGKLV